MLILNRTQNENMPDQGQLQVDVTNAQNNFPISDATVTITSDDNPETPSEQIQTNSSGQTENIFLKTPPAEYSQIPDSPRPYSEYTIRVTAEGFEPVEVTGTEILPGTIALQPIRMIPLSNISGLQDNILIPDHTLYGDYPPKIPEDELKTTGQSGEIVLSRVVVPETIVVHDGAPSNTSARNYYVSYRDYIKNVASSEIYATWPESALVANILAIMSFTMNRVYTEWYRNQGYNFTITSSTAYDQKWIYGRNVFEEISVLVDDLFNQYLSRPDVKQPLLTQYCDGKRVTCPDWLSQWGSKSLGDQGYSPIQILRNYYGSNIYINSAEQISGIPSSWPGYNLTIGSSGNKVRQLQEQLATIAEIYTAIPMVNPDGIFGEQTQRAVEEFQSIFGMRPTGDVDFPTWYRISQVYVGIARLAEF